jgi:hypothetical protein
MAECQSDRENNAETGIIVASRTGVTTIAAVFTGSDVEAFAAAAAALFVRVGEGEAGG